MALFEFSEKVMADIHEHALAEYPIECCGWVLEVDGVQSYKPSKNLQDKYHKFDPESYPRTGREAFLPEMNKLQADLDSLKDGDKLFSIVHSHIDVGAYFSEEDKIQMSDPESKAPIYNADNYLVVAVKEGKITEHAVFYFADGDYQATDYKTKA